MDTGFLFKDHAEGKPKDHHAPNKKPGDVRCFVNPWPSFNERGFWDMVTTFPFTKRMPKPLHGNGPEQVEIDMEKVRSAQKGELQITWLGHAAFLVQVAGLTMLTDPALSDRCSPVPFLGPARFSEPAATPESLPERIDAVIISHNHLRSCFEGASWGMVCSLGE